MSAPTRNVDACLAAWGEDAPGWLRLLAGECDASSQADVAKRLRYSGTVVNQVLRRRYSGSYEAVEQAVMGVFADATVDCPVLGHIGAHACLEHQRRPFAATNRTRVQLYRACRSGCTHSRINAGGNVAKESA